MTAPASRGRAAWAIGLLALLIVSAGLYVIGGPGEARKQRRDDQRQRDLQDMAALIECLAQENGNRLPETVQSTPACEARGSLADPLTGTPYPYQVLTPRSYRICASYEAPARRPAPARKDCQTRRYIQRPLPDADAPGRP